MKKVYFVGVFILALTLFVGKTFAAPGDQRAPGPILAANGCGENNGVGVAFDGENVLFTCQEAAIRKTDINGTNLGSVATIDGANNPLSLDAIAWDRTNGILWGGNTDAGSCNIWSVDMTTGVGTHTFSFNAPNCNVVFFDGITVDPSDGTLWLSPDVHTEIFHYQTNGTLIAGDTIAFSGLTTGECPWAQGFGSVGCFNSGLAMGLDGNLFAGTAQDGKIYQLDPTVPASLGVFTTVTGRDEDLECGPLVEGFETILSRDYESGRIDILEAPDGTCVTTEISLDPSSAVNDLDFDKDHSVTATVLANGQPLSGVLVEFNVTFGPNTGQVSNPGECTTDVNCTTDAAGQTSWSYTSIGSGTDTIEACYTTAGGTEHCATATKDWVDIEITLDPFQAVNDLTVDQNHTITATVTANGSPIVVGQVQFTILSGPNAPEQSDNGECSVNGDCTTDVAGQTSWSYTNPNVDPSGLGTDIIETCYTSEQGNEHCAKVTKDWKDLTPPKVVCTETVNPHGKTTPPAGSTTLPGSRGGQNEDGFYKLTGIDAIDGVVDIFVNGFGAYLNGDKLKITEAPGTTPNEKKMGSSNGQADAIVAHLTLNSDPTVLGVDDSGNEIKVTCFVPPPPK